MCDNTCKQFVKKKSRKFPTKFSSLEEEERDEKRLIETVSERKMTMETNYEITEHLSRSLLYGVQIGN